jgi:hypothetical protein
MGREIRSLVDEMFQELGAEAVSTWTSLLKEQGSTYSWWFLAYSTSLR